MQKRPAQAGKGTFMSSRLTHFERLHAGLLYNAAAEEIQVPLQKARRLCAALRSSRGIEEKRRLFDELIPNLPESSIIEPPFHCDMGIHIRLGQRCLIGQNCVILDMGMVKIGDGTQIGPGCLIVTPHHPLDASLRLQPAQYAFPVRIGRNCRIGAGVIICPGIAIGDNCRIEAGSVVTKDIPANSLVSGCPARVTGSIDGQDEACREIPWPAASGKTIDALAALNAATPMTDEEERLQRKIFPDMARGATFCGPIQALAGRHVHFGETSFANYGGIFRDHGEIRLGHHTLLGPNCKLFAESMATRNASEDSLAPDKSAENASIVIGDDCWLGGSVTVCPGVQIGDRTIIGAGSVVTEDIPSDCLAAGHPATVKRRFDNGAGQTAPKDTHKAAPKGAGGPGSSCDPTEFQKMRLGLVYDFSDQEILASNRKARQLCASMDAMEPGPSLREVLEELIPDLPKRFGLVPPFRCDHGHGLKLGEGVFFNSGCTILDSGLVTIGDRCLFGPGCQIYTPVHPMDHLTRRETVEHALPVTIGRNCWFGAGAVVCPGVSIGKNCVVAAGSVVTRDLPDNALAAGRPARVLRLLA